MNEESRNAGGKTPVEVRAMFARAAPRYDFLNHFLSGGVDFFWRRRAAREAEGLGPGDLLVDLCAGTGDLAFALHKCAPRALTAACDFCREMTGIGALKADRRGSSTAAAVRFITCDALRLPFRSETVALVSCAFGMRNIGGAAPGGNRAALRETARVLRTGGKLVVLEFSRPTGKFFAPLYLFYLRRLLPLPARLLSRGAGDAYKYLGRSIEAYTSPAEFSVEMRTAGFDEVRTATLTGGTVTLYVGRKGTGGGSSGPAAS